MSGSRSGREGGERRGPKGGRSGQPRARSLRGSTPGHRCGARGRGNGGPGRGDPDRPLSVPRPRGRRREPGSAGGALTPAPERTEPRPGAASARFPWARPRWKAPWTRRPRTSDRGVRPGGTTRVGCEGSSGSDSYALLSVLSPGGGALAVPGLVVMDTRGGLHAGGPRQARAALGHPGGVAPALLPPMHSLGFVMPWAWCPDSLSAIQPLGSSRPWPLASWPGVVAPNTVRPFSREPLSRHCPQARGWEASASSHGHWA